ncbi:MAG: hypothetical protein IJI37_04825 [Opitutales bacterium]|nr:hypothetical protein [Opitutales bacterium]
MKKYLYLSLIPEALIASNLPPREFGSYFATGVFRRNCDQALFFEIDQNFKSDYLPVSRIDELCKPHADGSPHKSVYLSVYRALEHVPMSAFKNLYVATSDGKVLELSASEFKPDAKPRLYMYQDLAPCKPRVVSILNPREYAARLTSPERLVHVAKIAFCDLRLGALETDPENGDLGDLPYKNQFHLRDCIKQVRNKGGKNNKVYLRSGGEFLYRTIGKGFYVGAGDEFLFYPMPSKEDLENKYYEWWRSAQSAFGK